jgi:hypothetical protein
MSRGRGIWEKDLANCGVRRGAVVAKSATLAAAWLAAFASLRSEVAPAQHACDAIGEDGWKVIATDEITDVKDSDPYRVGDDWVIDRTTTRLPLCNYFNGAGNYSLRSYSLDPVDKQERVVLCRGVASGVTAPVAPYGGPCPPK